MNTIPKVESLECNQPDPRDFKSKFNYLIDEDKNVNPHEPKPDWWIEENDFIKEQLKPCR